MKTPTAKKLIGREELDALLKIKTFSKIAVVGYVISLVLFLDLILSYGLILRD